MTIQYFKPDIMINTCCEHCGFQCKETLERLYSNEKLACAACGCEHTHDRSQLRHTVEETEALLSRVPAWTGTLFSWIRPH